MYDIIYILSITALISFESNGAACAALNVTSSSSKDYARPCCDT